MLDGRDDMLRLGKVDCFVISAPTLPARILVENCCAQDNARTVEIEAW